MGVCRSFYRSQGSHWGVVVILQMEVDGVPEAVQMELIELQFSAALKATFKAVPLMKFYRMHWPTEKFPALIKHAKIIVSLFGSTYVCEQLFSKINFVKCKTRTQLTDGHLDNALRLTGTSLQPDVGHLVAQQDGVS